MDLAELESPLTHEKRHQPLLDFSQKLRYKNVGPMSPYSGMLGIQILVLFFFLISWFAQLWAGQNTLLWPDSVGHLDYIPDPLPPFPTDVTRSQHGSSAPVGRLYPVLSTPSRSHAVPHKIPWMELNPPLPIFLSHLSSSSSLKDTRVKTHHTPNNFSIALRYSNVSYNFYGFWNKSSTASGH